MERVALDTSFLIDLQRERRAPKTNRGALEFLRAHPETELRLPVVAAGEFLAGFEDPLHPAAWSLIGNLHILDVTTEVARRYAVVTRALRRAGQLIGTNDLWIGCCAAAQGLPLLTANVDHFRLIPGLRVVAYRPSVSAAGTASSSYGS